MLNDTKINTDRKEAFYEPGLGASHFVNNSMVSMTHTRDASFHVGKLISKETFDGNGSSIAKTDRGSYQKDSLTIIPQMVVSEQSEEELHEESKEQVQSNRKPSEPDYQEINFYGNENQHYLMPL